MRKFLTAFTFAAVAALGIGAVNLSAADAQELRIVHEYPGALEGEDAHPTALPWVVDWIRTHGTDKKTATGGQRAAAQVAGPAASAGGRGGFSRRQSCLQLDDGDGEPPVGYPSRCF